MNYFNRALNLVTICIALSSLTLTTACSQSEFAGDTSPPKADAKGKKPNIKPCSGPGCNPTVEPPPGTDPSGQLSTDSGGVASLAQCANGQAVLDPSQTYSWQGTLRAGDDISGFVNHFNKYTFVNVGALHNDPATANFVCQLNGYLGGVVTTPGSFNSPNNNNIYRWDPNSKSLIPANAASDNNTIKGYLCKGKLKDPCKQDQSWIFQKLP